MAYVATYENEVLGNDLGRREVAWVYEHEVRKFPFYASAAVDDEIVVIGGRDKIVHALDPRTGERKWEWNSGARLDSSRSSSATGCSWVEAGARPRAGQGDREPVWEVRHRFRDHGFAGRGVGTAGHRQPRRHPVLLRMNGLPGRRNE